MNESGKNLAEELQCQCCNEFRIFFGGIIFYDMTLHIVTLHLFNNTK